MQQGFPPDAILTGTDATLSHTTGQQPLHHAGVTMRSGLRSDGGIEGTSAVTWLRFSDEVASPARSEEAVLPPPDASVPLGAAHPRFPDLVPKPQDCITHDRLTWRKVDKTV